MNSMPTVPRSDFEERLRFEMLLTELPARFVSATPESIDVDIVNAQKQIVQALGLAGAAAGNEAAPADSIPYTAWMISPVCQIP
jgi:hypothetical protein